MTEKPSRRRKRMLLVPLLGVGVAAWAVRSRLVERRTLQEGWQPLPPHPVRSAPIEPATPVPPVPSSEKAVDPAPDQLELAEPRSTSQSTPEPTPTDAEPVAARARAVPAATAVASVTAPALPESPFGPGSVRAGSDGSSPDAEYVVKGKRATRVFYAPGSPYYARTRADVWFRTDDDARAAGFTPRAPRRSS